MALILRRCIFSSYYGLLLWRKITLIRITEEEEEEEEEGEEEGNQYTILEQIFTAT